MRLLLVRFYVVCVLGSGLLTGCKQFGSSEMFRKVDPGKSGFHFSNNLQYNDSLTVLEFEYMFNGAGVALIDINNDGLQDILMGGNMVPSRLFLNKGKLRFEDITEKAGLHTNGWAYGISVADINQDGFQDFYICKAGSRKTLPADMRNEFYLNNGNNTFTEAAQKLGLDEDGYDIHAAFFDYDRDGDLDMYLLRNAFVNYNRNNSRPKETTGKAASTDKLFRNNGDGTFSNVSAEAGITIEGFGLGVNICDINNDNWPDVYVSNDFLTNDLIWINNRNGTFTNKAGEYLRHQTYNGMGNDVADYNNDGHPDIVVVDMLPPDNKRWKLTMEGNTYDQFQENIALNYEPQYVRNTLQLNNGNGSFSEVGRLAGVEATEWSWAPLFADFDNDGWKDLFISNGYRQDVTNMDFIMYGKKALFMGTAEANRRERLEELKRLPGIKVHNYMYRNRKDLTFADVSGEWGMTEPDFSNGAAYGDLDHDGDLDLIVNNLDQPSAVYENRSNELQPHTSWLRLRLLGAAPNRDGFGAQVWVWQNGTMQYNYFTPYRGYLSSVEQVLHFGLDTTKVDSVKVRWPNGYEQLMRNVSPRQILTLKIADAKPPVNTVTPVEQTLFTEFAGGQPGYKHEEDIFNDFKLQPLLPHMHSRGGPAVAVADVNGDGLEDFFAGAAAGKHPAIFVQQAGGKFVQQTLPDSNVADNMGALFFDADNDGDEDLYVASGGVSTKKKEHPDYKHRLFINDGRGKFVVATSGMPDVITAGASVMGCDYDRDGDIDLFVCGRSSPGEYPLSPRSYLLRNDTKHQRVAFTDITQQYAPALAAPGMVSSGLWTDFDGDGWTDLVLVGEFTAIRFFKNSRGTMQEITATTGLENTSGWWNSITGADFDRDGDIDYIVGNVGLNGPYQASPSQPVSVYASDYDKNGRLDPVLCHFVDNREYTVHARDDMNRQMTAMRARFRTYENYANVSFREGFRPDEVEEALVLKAERFNNVYVENKGNGKFAIRSLPLRAQFAPVFGMVTGDFNADGNMDVAAVGNSFATEVQTGRYDARGSMLLLGNGKGNFTVTCEDLNDRADNKSVSTIQLANGTIGLVVGTNDDSLKIFTTNKPHLTTKTKAGDTYMLVLGADGVQSRQEIYHGHSYLSQAGKISLLPARTKSVTIYNYTGHKRVISF